jgi:mycothiol system anti-sigma-R factor
MEYERDPCTRCEELLQPYLDRVLSEQERTEVWVHLESCGYCAKHYRFEETLWRHVRKCCYGEPVPRELKDRLRALRSELY